MVTRFSDLTLDNTPGAGSYVPYVDPTEAVAADRSKRLSLTLPLYTITGYTATLPAGESAVANYADLAAFEAAVTPVRQGQRVQVAGSPTPSVVGVFEARYIAGSWDWVEV